MKKTISIFKIFLMLNIMIFICGMKEIKAEANKSLTLSGVNTTCNVYAKSDGKQVLTYINPLYQRDVPLIADTTASSKYYKIMVSGVEGWISKTGACFKGGNAKVRNVSAIPYYTFNTGGKALSGLDVSRYQVVGNKMYFALVYGASNITYNIGYTDVPSGLENNKIYYSYDGNYFYSNYNTMVTDYKNKTRKNAKNAKKPYYDYYQYLPLRSKSTIPASTLTKRLLQKEPKAGNKGFKETKKFTPCSGKSFTSTYSGYYSIVYNQSSLFVTNQNKYNLNAGIIYGIMLNESANGTSNYARHYKNLFGWGAYDSCPNAAKKYSSISKGISSYYSSITSTYANPAENRGGQGTNLGNKKAGSNVKYASDPHWGYKNAYNYRKADELAGNVDKNTYSIGIINSGKSATDGVLSNEYTKVYSKASTSSSSPYYYEKNGSAVIVLGTSGSFYKIQKDQTSSAGVVYIEKSKVTIANTAKEKIEYQKVGTVHYIWGKNNLGQLGNSKTAYVKEENKINLNTLLPKGEVIKSVLRYNNTNIYVLTNAGNVYSSGSNSNSQRSYTSKANKFTKVNPFNDKISAIQVSGNRLRMQRTNNKNEYYFVGKNSINLKNKKFNRTTLYPVKVRYSKNIIVKGYYYSYSKGKVSDIYNYSNNLRTSVYSYKYNSLKQKTYQKTLKYSKGVLKTKYEYYFVNGQKKSTSTQSAYRYKTYYKKGKAYKSVSQKYSKTGKLSKAVKIKTRK
ncbi:beta-N-acetylglucosaminidase [Bacilli bacterium PM5-3]|nr:beta-N-acetylglucosaminidase [Bacilli bacterium PM5-3]MDH6603266.1 beta-N-acetylglucosaminidase [Bacilli bacterium PM5-9]